MRWLLPIGSIVLALLISGCGPDAAVPNASCWRSNHTFTAEECQTVGDLAGCSKSEVSEDGGCVFKNCDERPDCDRI